MSIIDTANNHSIIGYTSGVTKAFSGQRLAIVNYRATKVTVNGKEVVGAKPESKCVSLPVITAAELAANSALLTPHFIDYLAGVQDKMVRELIAGEATKSNLLSHEFSIEAIAAWLAASSSGSDGESLRLSKDNINSWFDTDLADALTGELVRKLGISNEPTDAEIVKLERVLSAFKDGIAKLSAPKVAMQEKELVSLGNAIALATGASGMKSKLVDKIAITRAALNNADDLLSAL